MQRKPREAWESVKASPRRDPGWARAGAVATLLSVALVLAPLPARASEQDPGGSRVRVTLASSGKKIVGQLLEVNDEILVLGERRDNQLERRQIERWDVSRVEISERRSRKGTGAMIGMLTGVATAIAVGMAAGENCPDHPEGEANWGNFDQALAANLCFSHTETGLLTGLFTLPLGGLVGALVMPGELWRPTDLSHLSMGVGPAPGGGVAARVTLRF